MTIKPLGNRLVVRLVKQKSTTASGIIISTEEKNEQAIGEVVAIGEGQGEKENIKDLGLKVEDKVLFGKYAGDEVTDQDDQDKVYKILKGNDVLAVISEK